MFGARKAMLNSEASQIAVATRLDSVKSTLDDKSVEISEQATAIDGIEAQYTVKVNNNGVVSGFGFASTTASSAATSAFTIQADRFAIVAPSDSTNALNLTPASSVVPFEISSGSTRIKHAIIGELTANNILASTITADEIAANTITGNNILASSVTASEIEAVQLQQQK